VLYTGIPIFYHEDIYSFRIDKNMKYVYGFKKQNLIENLHYCLNDIMITDTYSKPYVNIELDYYNDYYIPMFYQNLYGKLLFSKNMQSNLLQNINMNKDYLTKEKYNLNIFAIYFPQFHRIKENDRGMYKNYTDFNNMDRINDRILLEKKIKTPLLGRYDLLAEENILQTHIDILQKYDLRGFAVYHYWFDKNLISDNNNIMKHVEKKFLNIENNNSFNYFFIWANENWNENLINLNEINEDNWQKHLNELIVHFNNNNYLKINNKPVFYILHYWLFDEHILLQMINFFNKKLMENNFDGIHIGLCLNFDNPIYKTIDCDYYINAPAWKNANKFGILSEENNETIIYNYGKK
jgi:hypothetical protein